MWRKYVARNACDCTPCSRVLSICADIWQMMVTFPMRISRTNHSSSRCEQVAEQFNGEPGQVPIVSLASTTVKRDTPRLLLFCFVLFFFTPSPVDALDTSRQISQYGHTAWRIEDGF